jgi:nitrite reductase/ring-hydroxylating ferredoxin subunit
MTQSSIEVYAVCKAESIPPGGAKAFTLSRRTGDGEARPYGIVVVRVRPREFVGYVNACPHGKVWLNIGDGSFFTPDGTHLRCGRHGAMFDVASGLCLAGPCEGASLEPIPLALMGSDVCLCGIALVEDDRASGYDGHDETMDIMIHPG